MLPWQDQINFLLYHPCFFPLTDGTRHQIGFAFTTFDNQVYFSTRSQWFNHQKRIAARTVTQMATEKKSVVYALMKYGSQASMVKSFPTSSSRQETIDDVKAAIEGVSEPRGNGDIENALQMALNEMFKKDGKDKKGTNPTVRKTLILFVEQGSFRPEELTRAALQNSKKLFEERGVTILPVVMGKEADISVVEPLLLRNRGQAIAVKDTKSPVTGITDLVGDFNKKGKL